MTNLNPQEDRGNQGMLETLDDSVLGGFALTKFWIVSYARCLPFGK